MQVLVNACHRFGVPKNQHKSRPKPAQNPVLMAEFFVVIILICLRRWTDIEPMMARGWRGDRVTPYFINSHTRVWVYYRDRVSPRHLVTLFWMHYIHRTNRSRIKGVRTCSRILPIAYLLLQKSYKSEAHCLSLNDFISKKSKVNQYFYYSWFLYSCSGVTILQRKRRHSLFLFLIMAF